MNAAPERKVFDSDLASVPELRRIATQYASEYVGNFDVMVQAKLMVEFYGSVPEPYVRTVLNCLRCDPTKRELWFEAVRLIEPKAGAMLPEHGPPIPDAKTYWRNTKWPRLTVVKDERVFAVRVKARWKAPLATALWMGAKPVVHLMLSECEARWKRPRTERDGDYFGQVLYDQPLEVFDVSPRALCARHHSGRRYWFARPTYEMAYPGRWGRGADTLLVPFCRTCVRLYHDESCSLRDHVLYAGEVA